MPKIATHENMQELLAVARALRETIDAIRAEVLRQAPQLGPALNAPSILPPPEVLATLAYWERFYGHAGGFARVVRQTSNVTRHRVRKAQGAVIVTRADLGQEPEPNAVPNPPRAATVQTVETIAPRADKVSDLPL